MTTESDGVFYRAEVNGIPVGLRVTVRARRSGSPDPRPWEINGPADWLPFDLAQLERNEPHTYEAICNRLYGGELDPRLLRGLTQVELEQAFSKGLIPSGFASVENFTDWLQTVPLIPDEE